MTNKTTPSDRGALYPIPFSQMTDLQLENEIRRDGSPLAMALLAKMNARRGDYAEKLRDGFDVGFGHGYEAGAREVFARVLRVLDGTGLEDDIRDLRDEDFEFDAPPSTDEAWILWDNRPDADD